MFWFLFLHLFAATIFVAPCVADDYEDEFEDAFGAICPNEVCYIESTRDVTPDPLYRVRLYPRPNFSPLQCCVLSGLQKDEKITRKYGVYGEYSQTLLRIIIENSKIERIPKDLMAGFKPSILHIIHGGLTTLKIVDFTGATNLAEFNATHNQIEKLEPNLFIFAPNIESIDLSNNRIMEVSQYTFDYIPILKVLVLSNNLIKKLDFELNLNGLSVFIISNNSLELLNENLLRQSFGLTELCIDNNNLNISKLNITDKLDVFDMSYNPTSIDLTSKKIRIKNSNVKKLTIRKQVVAIDASDNQISSIVVDPENSLIELNLSRNNYTTFRNLSVLTSVEKLDLSFNQIEDFSLSSFFHMTQLRKLNLENSGLKTIDFGLFAQQKYLNWLDISYNNLKAINFNMLTTSIERLFIEGNDLTNIDLSDIAITLPHLKMLGLSNNKFSCEKLIEIRKILTSHDVQMYVDEQLMVKFSRNINGIGCSNENSSDSMELNSTKLLPIHTNKSDQDQFIETIHSKINEIETNIRQHSDSLNENSINSKDDILSVKQELMNIRSDSDLKIIEAKADILMSISRLFNVSTNGTNVNIDLKSTVEEINKINLERYQSLSLELKVVKDKLQDLVQSSEIYDRKNVLHLKQNGIDDDHSVNESNVELISLKNMMTFIIVTIVCLIFGFSLILFYKRFYKEKRRYISTNTVNTSVEQSLV